MTSTNRLREFRTKLNMSQVELHDATGIAQATISNVENGTRMPSYLTRQKLAEALNTTVEELFPNGQDMHRKVRAGGTLRKNATTCHIISAALLPMDEVLNYTTIEGSVVSGLVVGDSGTAVKLAAVKLFKVSGTGTEDFGGITVTRNNGVFAFEGLKSGLYRVQPESAASRYVVIGTLTEGEAAQLEKLTAAAAIPEPEQESTVEEEVEEIITPRIKQKGRMSKASGPDATAEVAAKTAAIKRKMGRLPKAKLPTTESE